MKTAFHATFTTTISDVEYKCRKNVSATVSAFKEHLDRTYTDEERQKARQNLAKRI